MRQDAVDLIVALKGYTLPKQAEYAHHRLCKAIAEKKWHGLTDEDKQIAFDDSQEGVGFWEFADAIEAILKRKNYGKDST